jgi:hypothetical protein
MAKDTPVEHEGYLPIDKSAKDGRAYWLKRKGEIAAGYWTGSEWAVIHPGSDVAPLHFKPTEYKPLIAS